MSDDNFACELPRHHSTDDEIRAILEDYRVIAVVGLSTDASRPSHGVAAYMQQAGYRIVPIHPKAETILGEKAYANLELTPPVTLDEAKKAWRKLMAKYHPDRHQGDARKEEVATKIAAKLTEAYRIVRKDLGDLDA